MKRIFFRIIATLAIAVILLQTSSTQAFLTSTEIEFDNSLIDSKQEPPEQEVNDVPTGQTLSIDSYYINASPISQPGSTTQVSIPYDGSQANHESRYQSISSDGRFIAFQSRATNLVFSDTNGNWDVFIRDLQTNETTRVSLGSLGVQANGACGGPSISSDGRLIAFESSATNLVDNDTNGFIDVFVRDLLTNETTIVSISSSGIQGNNISLYSSISGNGRYVAFISDASNLVQGDTNGRPDVFVHDCQTRQTMRVSLASDGTQANYKSEGGISLSFDGRFVAFASYADNLVSNDSNGVADIFVHDQVTKQTIRASVSSSGSQGNNFSLGPSISGDGHFVAFTSAASNFFVSDLNETNDIFVRDIQGGQTIIASVSSNGNQANEAVINPSISSDGRFIAYQSFANNLVLDDTNNQTDNFLHDRQTGETIRVSISSEGVQGNNDSWIPTISSDGCYIAFESDADNLVLGDTNGYKDIFSHHQVWCNPGPFVDLDVSSSTISLANSQHHLKENQPSETVLETIVTNHGPDPTTRLTVEFHDGFPSTDTKIASTTLYTINSGDSATARVNWKPDSSPIEANIYVKVTTIDNDIDISNNITSNLTHIHIAFAHNNDLDPKFKYNPDTFRFRNWFYGNLAEFKSEFLWSSEKLNPTQKNLYLGTIIPYLYYFLGSGGHCYGMSTASIIYWDTPLEKPVPIETYQMDLESQIEVAQDIEIMQARQIIKDTPTKIIGYANKSLISPKKAYQKILENLENETAKPTILNLSNNNQIFYEGERWNHAVTAYKIVEIGDFKYIFVYDNNHPYDPDMYLMNPDIFTLTADIIKVDEENDLMVLEYLKDYSIPSAIASNPLPSLTEISQELLDDLINATLGLFSQEQVIQGVFSWGSIYSESGSNSFSTDNLIIAADQPTHFIIRDSSGNRLGYDRGVYVKEIEDAEFNNFVSAFQWLLPADGQYTLETEGTGTTFSALTLLIPLSTTLVQSTIYDGFSIPQDAAVSTTFSQTTTDWRIEIEGQEDVLPVIDEEIPVEGQNEIFLPLIIRD